MSEALSFRPPPNTGLATSGTADNSVLTRVWEGQTGGHNLLRWNVDNVNFDAIASVVSLEGIHLTKQSNRGTKHKNQEGFSTEVCWHILELYNSGCRKPCWPHFLLTNDDDTRFRLQNWVSVEGRRNVESGEFMEIEAEVSLKQVAFAGYLDTFRGRRFIIKTSGGRFLETYAMCDTLYYPSRKAWAQEDQQVLLIWRSHRKGGIKSTSPCCDPWNVFGWTTW